LYKEKAIFEAEKMHDWNSAKLYSEKALLSLEGVEVKPQEIGYWKLPDNKVPQLQISYNNLMTVYEKARKIDPYNLAVAISSLDCWAEQQEENWQTWDINECKDDFLSAMHIIYEKISQNQDRDNKLSLNENKDFADNVSLVTKNEKKEIMQIIYFDFDKAELSTASIKTISKFLSENKNTISSKIIVGHTDTKGTKKKDLELSLKRNNT
jgi:Outer membrane protein and related peptidoglycan-associated (lipo)proteins